MPQPSILLVHGAASGAWVWDAWRRQLSALGWQVNVLDLRGHGRSLPIDFATVSLQDYVADVASVTVQIEAAQGMHPILGGWGMGGLVAMMLAADHAQLPDLATMQELPQAGVPALLLFSPALPREAGGRASLAELRRIPLTAVGPEQFGVFPDDPEASRATLFDLTDDEAASFLARSAGAGESGLVRRQMERNISIPSGALTTPTLVVYGGAETGDTPRLQRELSAHLQAESLQVASAGHWGLVYHERSVAEAAPRVDLWLQRVLN